MESTWSAVQRVTSGSCPQTGARACAMRWHPEGAVCPRRGRAHLPTDTGTSTDTDTVTAMDTDTATATDTATGTDTRSSPHCSLSTYLI